MEFVTRQAMIRAALAAALAGGGAGAPVRAPGRKPAEADIQYRLGIALFDAESFSAALGPLQRAAELSPQTARYRLPLATCLDRLGDRKAALEALRAIPELSPAAGEAALA